MFKSSKRETREGRGRKRSIGIEGEGKGKERGKGGEKDGERILNFHDGNQRTHAE